MKKGILKRNDLLIVKDGATTGKSAFVDQRFPYEKAAVNEHVFIVRVNSSYADPKYVFYYLHSPEGKQKILKNFHGMIGGIHSQFISHVEIPIVQISSQKKIVQILDKVKLIQYKNKISLEYAQKIPQLILIKTFGDPITNPKGWELKRLNDVASKIVDGTHKTPQYVDKGVPFLTIKNIVKNRISLDDIKYIRKEDHVKLVQRCKPEKGDILYSKDGTMGVARVIDIDLDFSIFVSLALIKIDRSVLNPWYLENVLNLRSVRRRILRSAKGQALRHLHLVDIRKIVIPIPPIDLQQEYENKIAKILSLREKELQSRKRLDQLANSLYRRLFKGELG